MNRTFSLNNVSEIGVSPNSPQQQQQQQQQQLPQPNHLHPTNTNCQIPTIAALAMTQAGSSASSVSTPTHNHHHHHHHHNLILPLTQASLALQNDQSETSSLRNMSSNKYGSKYASSNYLNETQSSQSQQQQHHQKLQPQQTRTTPRRRQPRNAEEFLKAAGIADPDQYLKKDYYAGSMVNLNEIVANPSNPSKSVPNPVDMQQMLYHQQQQQQQQQHQQHQSSSSSSSMTNGQKLSLKRRNSIHDTNSISLANLNSDMPQPTTGNKAYYRNTAAYTKMRSMTTAIVSNNQSYMEDLVMTDHQSTSNTSSAPVSDSSTSPTPSSQKQQLAQSQQQKQSNLGPLMSACSKMDAISPRSARSNQFGEDYDDYEYLEHNFNSTNPCKKNNDNNTTTNTNVTDYYTDESNSCHNEDFMSQKSQQQHQFILSEQKFRAYANTLNGLVESSFCGSSQHSTLGNSSKHTPVNTENVNNSHNINNNNNTNTNTNTTNTLAATNWEHTSLASTNSLFSGLYFSRFTDRQQVKTQG
jgi:hypothetical protein